MKTILLIILTIILLLFAIFGILGMKAIGYISSPLPFIFFIAGILGLFSIGMSLISDDIYTKESTVCMYTVGQNDEICQDNYALNLNYTFHSTSDKIGLIYLIVDTILFFIMLREIFIIISDFGNSFIRSDY